MKQKTKSRILPLILLVAVAVFLVVVLIPRLVSQSKTIQALQSNAKDKEIVELQAKMSQIKDQQSQEYKDLRKQFCLLTARPTEERAKAVANIKEFLGKPDVQVEFLCSRFAAKPDESGTDYNNPAEERYEAAYFGFLIDPRNNHIIEVGDAERTKRSDPLPEYDYSGRYNQPEELKEIAEKFLTDHKDIFGIDITKMTYEFEGTKPGNFFLKWKTLDGNGKTKELVLVTITNGGQIVRFDNDTYDLAKNGR